MLIRRRRRRISQFSMLCRWIVGCEEVDNGVGTKWRFFFVWLFRFFNDLDGGDGGRRLFVCVFVTVGMSWNRDHIPTSYLTPPST